MDRYLTDTDNLTRDCMDSLAAIFPDTLQTLPGSYNGRVIMRKHLHPERVNIIVSNGGGCYPTSAGYVAKGMADASVNGNIRTAPSAYDIYEAAKAIGSQKGYLLMYNNHMGDCLNNDLAAELLALDGIPAKLCSCTDDCLSAPPGAPHSERAGLTGIIYLLKIGAACVEKGLSLEESYRIIQHANERIVSVTVTLDFEKQKLCLGAGFSGEPPVLEYNNCFTMQDTAAVVYDLLVKELNPDPTDRLHLFVSRLDKTRCEEAFILAREMKNYSTDKHPLHKMNVGYITYLLNEYGFFVTLLREDEILRPYTGGVVNTESFIF